MKNPAGELTGRFDSIWRLESDGRWRVVFDQDPRSARASRKSRPSTEFAASLPSTKFWTLRHRCDIA